MLAPKLRHRIAFESMKKVQNPATGAIVETWVLVHDKVPAGINPLSGDQLLAAAAGQSKATDRMVIREGLVIDTKMRIVHGADRYNIIALTADPTLARHVTIMAEKGLRNG